MKSFWAAVVIAALLIGGGVLFNRHIDNVTEEMSQKEEKITALIEGESYDGAEKEIDSLKKYIDDKMIVLASVVDHKNIDEIELCVAEIEGYAQEKSKTEALARCKKLEHLISHLPINYSVTLQNIL
ncbi:MAG: DUF4363 family protein [Clostridia bacterium]|nr:DUF4363 family protein [Clostridia bacterium]